MDRAKLRAAMLEWFHDNFEDPAEETPFESAEGGYQYIWGGPYDAREELEEQFDRAPKDLIDEVVEEIEREGTIDWAPTAKRRDV